MDKEAETKIEFLQDIFPDLTSEDIIARIRSAPPSERSTDSLVSFFLAEEGKKVPNNNIMEEIVDEPHVTNTTSNTQPMSELPVEGENNTHTSKYQILDDTEDHDDTEHLADVNESIVSDDPVAYSAETGKIEKSIDQWRQEEDDLLLAQKLYEEEQNRVAAQSYQLLYNQTPLQHQSYQSIHDAPPPSPYHEPPSTNTTTTTSKPTKLPSNANIPTTLPPTSTIQPNKRPSTVKTGVGDKKPKSVMADQLQEIRKQQEDKWKSLGGKGDSNSQQGSGLNAGFYNQMKDIRTKQSKEWRDQKQTQKRVWTIGDIDAATKQARIDSGKMGAGDSVAERIGKEALELTNKFRKENKLPPLIWHSALCNIGAQHSKNMAEHKVPFGHDGFNERMQQYPMPHRTAAENVAMSRGISDVAKTAVEGWIDSPGHRKNLLSRSEYPRHLLLASHFSLLASLLSSSSFIHDLISLTGYDIVVSVVLKELMEVGI